MEASGDGIQPLGKEPQTGFLIYDIKQASFKVAVTGSGALYFSCAVLTDDALGVLENVEVGHYHDYEHRKQTPK